MTAEATTRGPLIPTVDLEGLESLGGMAAVSEQVDAACREVGFFLVKGHAVPEALHRGVYEVSRTFFDLDESRKQACAGAGFLGYRGVGTLKSSTTSGQVPRDFKETFSIGRESTTAEAGSEFAPPNTWPADIAGFRDLFLSYHEVVSSLAVRIGEVFAHALGLPTDFFTVRADRHASWLCSINYPEATGDLVPGQMRFDTHRDRGCFTILSTTGEGLEVELNGSWHPVPAEPDALIVNVGSMLANWTGRRWISAMHRVRPPTPAEGRRQSLVFFFNPNHDTLLDPLPLPGTRRWPVPTGPARTVGEYLQTMLDQYR